MCCLTNKNIKNIYMFFFFHLLKLFFFFFLIFFFYCFNFFFVFWWAHIYFSTPRLKIYFFIFLHKKPSNTQEFRSLLLFEKYKYYYLFFLWEVLLFNIYLFFSPYLTKILYSKKKKKGQIC